MTVTIKKLFLFALLLPGAGTALAGDAMSAANEPLLKPFILGSKGTGTAAEKAAAAQAALAARPCLGGCVPTK